MPTMRVLVVGAGLGGLAAANHLQQSGLEVVVLEARDRVGGRVWSHRFLNGTVVELGGEWIESSQGAVRGLAEDLGLNLTDTKQDFITRDLIGADPIPDMEHHQLAAAVSDAIDVLGRERLESMTIAGLLDTIPSAGPAMTVLRSRLAGTFGAPLGEMAATDLVEEFGMVQAPMYLRVEGGNDRLARELARHLDVWLSTPALSVAQSRQDVTVTTAGNAIRADFAVVAVPLPVLRWNGFLIDPDPALDHAIATLGMGTAAKVVIATAEEPPMFRRQEPDIPGWYWTGADGAGSTRQAVTGFAGTQRGVTTLVSEARQRLERAVPEVTLVGEPLVADWGSDPWAGGCYTALAPRQRALLPDLQRPWRRVVFAGEHVNGTGTIDGAIRSGHDAAKSLLEGV